jgi:hypothetical protein
MRSPGFPTWYKSSGIQCTCLAVIISPILIPFTGALQPVALDHPRHALHANAQQSPCSPLRPTPPHRSLSRPVRPQNTLLPLLPHLLRLAHLLVLSHNIRLSDMQHRAERPGTERPICTSYQESCGERLGAATEWMRVWETQARRV